MAETADYQKTVAAEDPTAKYKISGIDGDGDPKYFGFTDKDGGWYILALTTTAAMYAKGDSGYTTSWAGRAALSYDYFYNVF